MATGTVEPTNGPRGEALTLDRARQIFSDTFRTDSELSLIKTYYHPEVRFRDAIQQVEGREAFLDMTRRFLERSKDLQVEVHEAAQTGNVIFVEWTMKLRLGMGPLSTYDGTSRLILDAQGKVIEHRDYFDLWGDTLGALPGVGKLYRQVIKKLG
jgi:limonene-1,2-epoxide hydrolase